MKKNNSGFSVIEMAVVVFVILIFGFVLYYIISVNMMMRDMFLEFRDMFPSFRSSENQIQSKEQVK
jgi:hypothetical protein